MDPVTASSPSQLFTVHVAAMAAAGADSANRETKYAARGRRRNSESADETNLLIHTSQNDRNLATNHEPENRLAPESFSKRDEDGYGAEDVRRTLSDRVITNGLCIAPKKRKEGT
jgi:hypothetical protein